MTWKEEACSTLHGDLCFIVALLNNTNWNNFWTHFLHHRLYFHTPYAITEQQHSGNTSQLLFGFQKVTKLKIQVSCPMIRVLAANICLYVQAAICEHLPNSENHQSADCAAPRATRLLWFPHSGWWHYQKSATISKIYFLLIYYFLGDFTSSVTNHPLFLHRSFLTIVHTAER